MKRIQYIWMAAAIALLSACDKHVFITPPSPQPATGTVVYRLPQGLPEGTETLLTNAAGETLATALPLPTELEPGTYTLLVTTPHPGVTVNPQGGASLTPGTDGEVTCAPEFGQGMATFTVEEGKAVNCSPALSPMSREVKITVTTGAYPADRIEACEMVLSGIAVGKSPVQATRADANYFIRRTAVKTDVGLEVVFRLLGTDETKPQTLTITLQIAGEAAPRTFTEDMAEDLHGFNTGDYTESLSFRLELTIPVEGALSGTIIPWNDKEDIPVTGNQE